ncbi:MAG: DsbA family protein [Caulobacterales bacterium]
MLACAAVLAACSRAPSPPVNVEDREQVREVVREYLINDPALLKDALDALAARQENSRWEEMKSAQHDYAIGPENAAITIVEYFDYRCPYCHAAAEWVFDVAKSRRDVRVIFKEFPVLGPESLEAARAAIASLKQGKYEPFHRALMSYRGDLTSDAIDNIARQNGLDVGRMRRDMANPEIDEILNRNHELAVSANVTGTPGFIINGELQAGFNRAALQARLSELSRAQP